MNLQDSQGCTPLILAAVHNNSASVEILLDGNEGKNPADIYAYDKQGQSVLHKAAKEGNQDVIEVIKEFFDNNEEDDSVEDDSVEDDSVKDDSVKDDSVKDDSVKVNSVEDKSDHDDIDSDSSDSDNDDDYHDSDSDDDYDDYFYDPNGLKFLMVDKDYEGNTPFMLALDSVITGGTLRCLLEIDARLKLDLTKRRNQMKETPMHRACR